MSYCLPALSRRVAHATRGASHRCIRPLCMIPSPHVVGAAPITHALVRTQWSRSIHTVLGIESTCDETACAVVQSDGTVLGHALSSTPESHLGYGGIHPVLAARDHEHHLPRLLAQLFEGPNAVCTYKDIDAIAVANGPGLKMCLHEGVTVAQQLARAHQRPLLSINHLEAHALVARLPSLYSKGGNNDGRTDNNQGNSSSSSTSDNASSGSGDMMGSAPPQFPYLTLLISGGHSQLILMTSYGHYLILGTTLDDALGEAFDKTARLLGLPGVGGGEALEELARGGNPLAHAFSVPMRRRPGCDFSFSGLKAAVRRMVEQEQVYGYEDERAADIAASFQHTAAVHLRERTTRAGRWLQERLGPIGWSDISALVVCGGVARNHTIRQHLVAVSNELQLPLVCPPPSYCSDNGIMIAWAGLERLAHRPPDSHLTRAQRAAHGSLDLTLRPRWPLGQTVSTSIAMEGDSEPGGAILPGLQG